jgi:arylsulfatase A-like enzyme
MKTPLGILVGYAICIHFLMCGKVGFAADKPNILFILVDDLGKEWIGCYGAEGIETPNIDALAAGGMKFENAYCMPQCTPTRVTLLTGQYPFRHGWTNHWDVPRWGSGGHFDPKLNPSYANVLRDAGYATAAAGKWQIDDFRVEPNALDEAGFDEWMVWTGYEGGNPVSAERFANPYVHHGEKSEQLKGKFGPDVYCDFLVDFMSRNKDKPMLLYYPMCLTHPPLIPTPDEPEAKGMIPRHKAMVRYTDKLIGKLVTALEKNGLREKTVIVFTTDNGTSRGIVGVRDGHKVPGAKANMVEAGTAIPFIVNCPGTVPAGKTTTALTDFTDILPTFAELAGGKLPKHTEYDGHSLASLITGKVKDSARDWIFSMGGHPAKFRGGRVVPAQKYDDRVIRDKRYKLWVGEDGEATKLFDLKTDPGETNNLLGKENDDANAAAKNLMQIIESMPEKDGIPRYAPNPPQKWDKFKVGK